MMCLFFKFCQILKISNLLPARSLENPVKAQATPDCQRQFETDTHGGLRCRRVGSGGTVPPLVRWCSSSFAKRQREAII
jgi:hypothetical protein